MSIKYTSPEALKKSIEARSQDVEDIINTCSSQQFQYSDGANASIGAHIRHIIEFIKSLGDEGSEINYDARKRDIQSETDKDYALKQLQQETQTLLNKIDTTDLSLALTVKNDEHTIPATFGSQLMFIISHTTHHLAVIKLISAQQNITLNDDLGVAPSTLAYKMKLAAQ